MHAQPGRMPLLTKPEEERLVQHCLDMAEHGYGYDAIQIRNLVRYYLPGKQVTTGWWQKFTLRHPEVTRRRAQAFERLRNSAMTEENLAKFFKVLQLAFQKCRKCQVG